MLDLRRTFATAPATSNLCRWPISRSRWGVHESTVSRTVKDKYLQCSSGVYPLSYFFSRSLGGGVVGGPGDASSPDTAKAMLKKLITGGGQTQTSLRSEAV